MKVQTSYAKWGMYNPIMQYNDRLNCIQNVGQNKNGNSGYINLDSLYEVQTGGVSESYFIKIQNKEKKSKKELFNSVGQLLFTTKENEIDVRNYKNGMYYLRVGNAVKKVIIE